MQVFGEKRGRPKEGNGPLEKLQAWQSGSKGRHHGRAGQALRPGNRGPIPTRPALPPEKRGPVPPPPGVFLRGLRTKNLVGLKRRRETGGFVGKKKRAKR